MYYVKFDNGAYDWETHFFNKKENAVTLAKEIFIEDVLSEYGCLLFDDEQILNLYKCDLLAIEHGSYFNDRLEIQKIKTED